MKFSYSAIWNDCMALLRGNLSLLVALAGAFIFLPGLLLGYFHPRPTGTDAQSTAVMTEYLSVTWPWLLLTNIINLAGHLAVYILLFAGAGRTVGQAIVEGVKLLPFYLAALLLILAAISILAIVAAVPIVLISATAGSPGAATIAAVPIILVPMLYGVGRTLPLASVMAAERIQGPVRALRRTWSLTRSRGWAILGLFLIVGVTGAIVQAAIGFILGSLFLLVLGQDLGRLFALLLDTGLGTALSLVIMVLIAAVYRHLAAAAPAQPVS